MFIPIWFFLHTQSASFSRPHSPRMARPMAICMNNANARRFWPQLIISHMWKREFKWLHVRKRSWNRLKWQSKISRRKRSNWRLPQIKNPQIRKYSKWYCRDASERPSTKGQWKWHRYSYRICRMAQRYRANTKTSCACASKIFRKNAWTHWKRTKT